MSKKYIEYGLYSMIAADLEIQAEEHGEEGIVIFAMPEQFESFKEVVNKLDLTTLVKPRNL